MNKTPRSYALLMKNNKEEAKEMKYPHLTKTPEHKSHMRNLKKLNK